jgi:hypothetical protein|nr:MAG TPA: hypothetical protein [Caudoviricetes sp.]
MRRSCKRLGRNSMRREIYQAFIKPRRNYPIRKILALNLMNFKRLIKGMRRNGS